MLLQLLNSNSGTTSPYIVDAIAIGGAKLSDYTKNNYVDTTLSKNHYSQVFIQENSTTLFYTNEKKASISAIQQLTQKILKNRSTPFIVGTWPRQAGHDFYTRPRLSNFTPPSSPAAMEKYLHQFYTSISTQLGIGYLPLGEYWYYVVRQNPSINLHSPDGSHPSVQGTYLYALLMYKKITGKAPDITSWVPPGISAEEKKTLIDLVRR